MPDALIAEVLALIDRLAHGERDDEARDALLERLAAAQAQACEPFARLCARRGARFDAGPDAWPAVPTDVFRYARVASFERALDVRTFLTSGTTSGARGAHSFRDLSVYDHAARTAASHALLAAPPPRAVVLAPHAREAEASSLSYMLSRFEAWYAATRFEWAWRDGSLDASLADRALASAVDAGEAIAVLGTSFALVHLLDTWPERRWALPAGSLVMQTGGFKGRSRELDAIELRALLAARLGVPENRVVSEYGMTELSSQMYGVGLIDPRHAATSEGRERLWVPGWVRATPVDPETLVPVPRGEIGILRIDDCANVGSVCSIQTADLAYADGDALVLLGRRPGATPRGCSLAIEETLDRGAR